MQELDKKNRIRLKGMKQYKVKSIRIDFAGSSSVQKLLLYVHNTVTVLDTRFPQSIQFSR